MSAQPRTPAPSSAQIRVEIEHTRAAMDQTLDSLGDLLNPTRLVRVVRGGIEDTAADLLHVARLSPIAFIGSGLLVGFIVGQLVGRRR